MRIASILSIALMALGCTPPIPEGRIACAHDTDCPTGWTCRADRCFSSPSDVDAKGVDASMRDTGASDARIDLAIDAAMPDAGPTQCTTNTECSDGTFCNGAERCAPSDPLANAMGCAPPSGDACLATQTCDAASGTCVSNCALHPDSDGDGVASIGCGGGDCDDAHASVHPGAIEVCDEVDDDCNPATLGTTDADGDGVTSIACCNPTTGGMTCGLDCDDSRGDVGSGDSEVCDGADNDCDGTVDDGATGSSYVDGDHDGYGAGAVITTCPIPTGNATMAGDCDDALASVSPMATETCNGRDDDCDTTPDDGFACVQGATRSCTITAGTCTATGTQTCNATCAAWGACVPPAETCNRADDDCDGDVDENLLRIGTSVSVSPSARGPRSDWSNTRREAGVVFGVPAGAINEVWFARLGPSGAPIAAAIRVVANASSWDIAYDGAHWSVVVNEPDGGSGRRVGLYRVEAGTDVVSSLMTFTPTAGQMLQDVRVARIQAISDIAVVWGEATVFAHGVQLRYAGTTASVAPTQLGTAYDLTQNFGSGNSIVLATTTTGMTTHRIRYNNPTSSYTLFQHRATGAGYTVGVGRGSFGVNINLMDEVAALPSARAALLYDSGSSLTGTRLMAYDDSTAVLWDVSLSTAPYHTTAMASAGDAAFAVTLNTSTTTSSFERRRISDGASVDTAPLSIAGIVVDLVGITSGDPGRYIALTGVETGVVELRAVPIDCH